MLHTDAFVFEPIDVNEVALVDAFEQSTEVEPAAADEVRNDDGDNDET